MKPPSIRMLSRVTRNLRGGRSWNSCLPRSINELSNRLAEMYSKAFVECMFAQSRDRFGTKLKTGAIRIWVRAAAVANLVWTQRGLRVGVE